MAYGRWLAAYSCRGSRVCPVPIFVPVSGEPVATPRYIDFDGAVNGLRASGVTVGQAPPRCTSASIP